MIFHLVSIPGLLQPALISRIVTSGESLRSMLFFSVASVTYAIIFSTFEVVPVSAILASVASDPNRDPMDWSETGRDGRDLGHLGSAFSAIGIGHRRKRF